MKGKAGYIRQILIFALMLMSATHGYGQGTSIQSTPKKLYLGITLLPTQTTIFNNGVFNAEQVSNTAGYTLNGITEMGYNVTDFFGVSIGVGYKSYSTELAMTDYYNSYDSVDSENDSYEMQVSGSGIEEKQLIGQLSVPIKLQLQVQVAAKIKAFVSGGVTLSTPVTTKYSGTGTFDYNGYYSEYNITLYNLPEYGFPKDVDLSVSDKLNINNLSHNIFGSVGCTYELGPFIDLSAGIYYDQSLTSISNSSRDNFHLSKTSGEYNSLMKSASDVKTRAIGASVSMLYYFNL